MHRQYVQMRSLKWVGNQNHAAPIDGQNFAALPFMHDWELAALARTPTWVFILDVAWDGYVYGAYQAA